MRSSTARRFLRGSWPHLAAAAVVAVFLVWDKSIYGAIGSFRSPFLDWLLEGVSQLRGAALPAVVAVALIVIGWLGRRSHLRRAGTAMFAALLVTGAVTMILKEAIARPGPAIDDDPPAKSWLDGRYGRFPSSHSGMSFTAAGVLSAFVPAAAAPSFAMATLVSYERIYHGTHWPSDIVAGIWVGLTISHGIVSRLRKTSWAADLSRTRPSGRRTLSEETSSS